MLMNHDGNDIDDDDYDENSEVEINGYNYDDI